MRLREMYQYLTVNLEYKSAGDRHMNQREIYNKRTWSMEMQEIIIQAIKSQNFGNTVKIHMQLLSLKFFNIHKIYF